MIYIQKHATNTEKCKANVRYYSSARAGFSDLLNNLFSTDTISCVLLPSYIGFSPKEGSGIFDPVQNCNGLQYRFYHVDEMLHIDMDDVRRVIASVGAMPFALLRVDYYGFTDSQAEALYTLVKNRGGIVIEDNAHTVPTEEGRYGYFSDVVFYSLHKILPFKNGGMLMTKDANLMQLPFIGTMLPCVETDPWQYDLYEIGKQRRTNFILLERLAGAYKDYFTCMRTLEHDEGTIPYSFPVLLKRGDRFSVYTELNDAGYGVTCLYYALIAPLEKGVYPDCEKVSKNILNLSVHQDVDPAYYEKMLKKLADAVDK